MSTIPKIADSNLPEEGLRFFHSLSNWVESVKGKRLSLIEWNKGQRKLTLLNCIKYKQKEPLSVPENFLRIRFMFQVGVMDGTSYLN